MKPTAYSQWMPDSLNGGDITFTLVKNRVEIKIERGMKDWFGCTKAATFSIALGDVSEFAMGLSLFVAPVPPTAKGGE